MIFLKRKHVNFWTTSYYFKVERIGIFEVSYYADARIVNILYSENVCNSKICLSRIITDDWENKFNIQNNAHCSRCLRNALKTKTVSQPPSDLHSLLHVVKFHRWTASFTQKTKY